MKKGIITKMAALLTVFSLLAGCGGKSSDGKDAEDRNYEVNVDDIKLSVSNTPVQSTGGEALSSDYHPDILFKAENDHNNPLITNIFCADPTSVEYNGRLYVYGTNDNQQYLEKGDSENTYERIKSMIIISTDDMVNWQYEGEINTAEIAPWIRSSWAPSIVSREEADGLTHFYLYFSNNGLGVGVITATDPTGPWSDPLGEPLISAGMEGLVNCPVPFDPGVCIDDDGTGWLAFGGGMASDGSDYMPGSSRICRLGEDMLSIDSEFAKIPAPYFFEASELNYINDTYVYTFNTSWEKRIEWDWNNMGMAPPDCSMCYMTSKTPLDADSWEYCGYYLKNPGQLSMEYSNNHSHLHKYGDKYYLFFHTLILQKERGIEGGFRSLCSYEVEVNEETVTINSCYADRNGTLQIKKLDPYCVNQSETVWLTDCEYISENDLILARCSGENVIGVKGVDFGEGSGAFAAKVKGKGSIELRIDSFDSEPAAILSFDCADWTAVYDKVSISDSHNIFFVMSGDFDFDEWEFLKK